MNHGRFFQTIVLSFLFILLLGCSTEETLAQQDNDYYTQMQKIGEELFPALNPLSPVLKKYVDTKSEESKKELGVAAEIYRKKMIEFQKKTKKIKPTKGQEGNHEYVINRMEDLERFANALVRVAEGDEDQLLNAQSDLKKGYSEILIELFNDAKKHKE
ncbi:hypothetical protein [Paenibacillus sp. Soil750]|uniref:hypothetical protein n=1 Tax=Paenibacillus sp. Soil750 TaxID=1736398 RepID=UPI0007002271|nr:hypothetical protein [Paenibacillus sp. Soil750]KRE70863.1 hypothetical protein ASL11_11255 [Paenibacillus sp. Soil750]